MLNLKCPRCQHPAVLPPEMAGKPYQCTACQATLKIPGPKPATQTPAPAAPAKPAGIPPDHYGVKCPKCLTPVLIPKSMSGMDYECTECQAMLKVPGGKKPAAKPGADGANPELPPLTVVSTVTDSFSALTRHGNILTYYGITILVFVIASVLVVGARYLDLLEANLSTQFLFRNAKVPPSVPGAVPRLILLFLVLRWALGMTAMGQHALRGEAIKFKHFGSSLGLTLRAILPYFFLFVIPWLAGLFGSAALASPSTPIRFEKDLRDFEFKFLVFYSTFILLYQLTLGSYLVFGFNNELLARPDKSFGDVIVDAFRLVTRNYLRIVPFSVVLFFVALVSSIFPPVFFLLAPIFTIIPSRIYFVLVAEAEARGD
jgi:ribosomal protein S27E